jgi:uncharacterized protein (TIGR03083 family)
MQSDRYFEAIEQECAAFTMALREGATQEVPSCPGWRVSDLTAHLGMVQRWATEMVRSRATERLGDRERFAIDPNDPRLVEWFQEGARDLVGVLRATPADAQVWNWTPDRNVQFWIRRQAHETAVHRWDAESAVGVPRAIDADLAADGVDEWFRVFAIHRSRGVSTRFGKGESFHFHCTDTAGEWVVQFDGSDVEVRSAHEKADVAIRGHASDLLLFVWGRTPAEQLEVLGDASLTERWRELLPSV